MKWKDFLKSFSLMFSFKEHETMGRALVRHMLGQQYVHEYPARDCIKTETVCFRPVSHATNLWMVQQVVTQKILLPNGDTQTTTSRPVCWQAVLTPTLMLQELTGELRIVVFNPEKMWLWLNDQLFTNSAL